MNRRIFIFSLTAAVAIGATLTAKALLTLIQFVASQTNLDSHAQRPTSFGIAMWFLAVPALGGLVVGLMARYGSPAIRGHGIPEAMEQILLNESRIPWKVLFLKPISSAIAIGTGGPFGAEGPIIATGGALGSLICAHKGFSQRERKTLLAAGAAAGMAAIFSTPLAAVLLALELLLFEMSAETLGPVIFASCLSAILRTWVIGTSLPFPAAPVAVPSLPGLALVIGLSLCLGCLSVLVTKSTYWVEDRFEHLKCHWMWWPAIGGLFVGIFGILEPKTFGVGYDNIVALVNGKLAIGIVASLLIFKFLSWTIALGSGTSGGTLAPLMMLGGAAGTLVDLGLIKMGYSGIPLGFAAVIGMVSLFSGCSHAFLTSAVFAVEATGRFEWMVYCILAATLSHQVSYRLAKTSIMTEKIHRRGVAAPNVFRPETLQTNPFSEGIESSALSEITA